MNGSNYGRFALPMSIGALRCLFIVLCVVISAHRSLGDVCDDLRLRLAQAEVRNAELSSKLNKLEKRLAELDQPEPVSDRSAEVECQERARKAEVEVARLIRELAEEKSARLRAEKKHENSIKKDAIEVRPATQPRVAPRLNTAASSDWRFVNQTQIDGLVNDLKHGSILKTLDGAVYEITDFTFVLAYQVSPAVTVISDGVNFKLYIDGVETGLQATRLDKYEPVDVLGDPVILSRIDGQFEGLEYERIYKLQNGQIWQQSSFRNRLRLRLSPEVVIWKHMGRHEMRVDGVADAVTVEQLK